MNQLFEQLFKHQPTADQVNLFGQIDRFLKSEAPNSLFVLKGYAGTGKTTSMSVLVKLLPKYQMKAILLAPTGRAAKVLGNYSQKPAYTIHKKIYRKKSAVEFGSGFSLAKNTHTDTLFIVDESSMIPGDVQEGQYFGGNSLLSDLITYVYESDSNCKILFLGDTAQLPPVGASESPALNPTYLQDHFGLKVFSAELKEVLRQEKKSGILENATALRLQLLAENISKPSLHVKNFKDFFYITGEKLVDGINYAYDHFGMDETLIICRSNKNANLYNQQIRARILFREEFISSGDFLMVVKNNYHWLPESSDGEFIANGEIAKVIRIRNEQEMYGLKFADASLQLVDFPTQPIITAKIILDTLDSDSPALSNAQQKHLYEQVALDYADIKNKSERLAKIKTDPYYNALQVKFSYAVTCHKSQGGQWKAVFVDQGYLTDELVNKEFIRWLYTAITRASEQLFLVNFNKDFIVDLPKDNF